MARLEVREIKAQLRTCARRALEARGYVVEDASSHGMAAGAKLLISNPDGAWELAVRPSMDRQIGLVRDSQGRLRTIPGVDFVAIAVPTIDNPQMAEVLFLESQSVQDRFGQELASRRKPTGPNSAKSPIYLPVDDERRGRRSIRGLKHCQIWRELVPLDSRSSPDCDSIAMIRGAEQEFRRTVGRAIGIDPDRIKLDWRVDTDE